MPIEEEPEQEGERNADDDDAAFEALLTISLKEARESNIDMPDFSPLDKALTEIRKARIEKLKMLGCAVLVGALLMPWEYLIKTMTTTPTSMKHLMYAAALGLIINIWMLFNDAE